MKVANEVPQDRCLEVQAPIEVETKDEEVAQVATGRQK